MQSQVYLGIGLDNSQGLRSCTRGFRDHSSQRCRTMFDSLLLCLVGNFHKDLHKDFLSLCLHSSSPPNKHDVPNIALRFLI